MIRSWTNRVKRAARRWSSLDRGWNVIGPKQDQHDWTPASSLALPLVRGPRAFRCPRAVWSERFVGSLVWMAASVDFHPMFCLKLSRLGLKVTFVWKSDLNATTRGE